jgi:hypothetical protein
VFADASSLRQSGLGRMRGGRGSEPICDIGGSRSFVIVRTRSLVK